MPRIPLVRLPGHSDLSTRPLPQTVLTFYVFAYRTHLRVLLFAGIAAFTGWATFTSYSAKLDESSEQANPSQEGPRVPPIRPDGGSHANINKNYGNLPLSFEANRGQTDASVKFVARGPGYNIFLAPGEVVLTFQNTGKDSKKSNVPPEDPDDVSDVGPASRQCRLERLREGGLEQSSASTNPTVVKMRFEGANADARVVEGVDKLPGKVNYFLGNDSSKWLTNIPTYRKVTYRNVYSGVDLVYYGNGQQLEYDLVVAPGADPNLIKLRFDGVENLRVDKQGNLLLKTKAGEIQQQKPLIYQEENNERKLIEGHYVMRGKNKVGFRVSRYDLRKPLLIDPVLSYFSIANNSGDGYAIAVDAQGFAYITGTSQDANFNPTPGAFQQDSGGSFDVFVTKINQSGSAVVYSTYLGGAFLDEGYGIAVDAQGNAYLTGYAGAGFPTTPGAYQTTPSDDFDCFITKLNPAGSGLVYSTFFGGNGFEQGNGIAVDSAGNSYVAGITESTNLPTSAVAAQTVAAGGYDAFVMSLNSGGSALRYSSYLGGGGLDYGLALAIDSSTNVYVAGQTRSLNFPTVNSIKSAGGLDRGLFKSLDSGTSWSLSRNGLTDSNIAALAVAPSLPSTVYAATSGTVFKSTDSGANWTATNVNSITFQALAIDPFSSSIVYAGSAAGLHKTTDGGGTWTLVYSNSSIQAVLVDPTAPQTIYAGTLIGVIKSTNGGSAWTTVFGSSSIQALAIDPTNPRSVYAGGTGGVRKTVDSGTNWSTINSGLSNTNVRSLAIAQSAPATLYAGTVGGGIFKTTTAGTSWSAANNGFLIPGTDNVSRSPAQVNAIAIDPTNPSLVYAASSNAPMPSGAYPLSAILKSTNGGTSWSAITNGFGNLNSSFLSLAIDPTNTSRIYAGNSGDTDGFVTKISPIGSTFLFSSYLGSGRADAATGIALDPSGNPYVTGVVGGTDFPTTVGAFQTNLRGAVDLFVTKLSAASNILVYSTYLGGSAIEGGIPGVAVDSSGSAYVNGRTSSTDFPVTAGAFQTTIGNPGTVNGTDESVSKLNTSGSGLIYSSYLGGGGNEPIFATTVAASKIAVDGAGNAYVVGVTSDITTLPVTAYGGGKTYIAKIEPTPSSFSITGRLLTTTNTPIAGVFIQVSNGQDFFRSVRTDSQGYYSLISLPPGDYTVTPDRYDGSGRHYLYTPPTRTFTGFNSDQTANFTGTLVFDIQGQVTSSTVPGLGIFDVTVTLSGAASATAITDVNGRYSLQNLLPGNYTVTPSKAGFTFNPVNRVFTNLSADQFSANFTTASASFFTVSGRVADAGNVGVSNATVLMVLKPMVGERSLAVQTDANGNYSFTNLQAGGNYTFVPVKPLLTFTPQSQTFSNLNGNQTLNFLAAQATGLIGKIAFVRSDEGGETISVMNADGSAETNIASTGGGECSGDSGPAWSPDGSKIAFSTCAVDSASSDISLVNADGSGVGLLTGEPRGESFPSWSPDATRLTYTFGECSGTDTLVPEIFAIDATGMNRTQLTTNAVIDVSSDWSPNGSRIVFARGLTSNCSSTEAGGDPDLYEMDASGGNERRLTSDSDSEFWPTYSPDASKIAFTRGNEFAESIYVMNADGTGAIKVTPDFIFARKPTWSPDGTKIAFAGYLEGGFGSGQIFVINADGTGLAQITSGSASRGLPSWQHFSISGRVIGNTDGLPVTMTLAGTLTRTTQTNANGNYLFGNLTPGGNYSVRPVSPAFVFSPAQTDFTNLVGNQIANFNVVPQAVPTATPPLVDNFAGGQRDPAKWNLGTQTQPMGAFDPGVTVVQTNGQLVIAPRANLKGPHYNGYVSVNSFDMTGGSASLEMVQPAPGGAETIFAIGSDLDNFFRFAVTTPVNPSGSLKIVKDADGAELRPDSAQLLLQVKIAGQLSTLPFPYDPVQHHFMRFRHEPPTNSILFETSPNGIDYTIQLRQELQKGLSALAVELSAGTSTPTTPGQAVLDNFSLVTSTFQFASAGYTVGEGDGSVLITVTRASSTATDAGSVDYATADGTALQGTKYIQTTGKLTFAAGQTSKTFSVPIVDNPLAEGNQTLDLVLSNSTGSGLNSPGRAVLTIIDNETVLTAGQAEIKTWTFQGTTYAYLKLSFPNAGYRVANWGQAVRAGNDFSADALVEKLTGASVQAVTTTAQIYDLGALAPGSYNFTFKNSGTVVKTLAFTVAAPPFPPNPIDNAREFVKQQYRDFLNREADQAGEDFWTDNITKCSDPARRPPGQTEAECTTRQKETTSGAFFLSPEFQYTGYYVLRMYKGGLGRQPKLSEFISDAQFVGAGILVNSQLSGAKINQNKADYAQQFVNCTDAAKSRCAEFKVIYDGLNNQQYVDKLFLTTGVNASASDRTALVNGLNANPATETRASVLQKVVDGIVVIAEGNQQFTTSYGQAFYNSESNRAFVQLEYFGYMKRDPDDAGYAFWLGKLNQFGGNFVNAEMVLAFISSPEYRARFGQP